MPTMPGPPPEAAESELVPFGLLDRPRPHASPAVLAELHAELLPTSPAVRLGSHFLQDFYYVALPEKALIFGYVAYHGDVPVGFVVNTRDANGFLASALRTRWRTLVAVMARHPPSPRSLLKATQLAGDRSRHRDEKVGELLSLAVRPSDQRGLSSGPSRRRLARALMESVLAELAGLDVIALVDESNAPARLMYADLGWTMAERVTAGWPVPQLIYRLGENRSPDR